MRALGSAASARHRGARLLPRSWPYRRHRVAIAIVARVVPCRKQLHNGPATRSTTASRRAILFKQGEINHASRFVAACSDPPPLGARAHDRRRADRCHRSGFRRHRHLTRHHTRLGRDPGRVRLGRLRNPGRRLLPPRATRALRLHQRRRWPVRSLHQILDRLRRLFVRHAGGVLRHRLLRHDQRRPSRWHDHRGCLSAHPRLHPSAPASWSSPSAAQGASPSI